MERSREQEALRELRQLKLELERECKQRIGDLEQMIGKLEEMALEREARSGKGIPVIQPGSWSGMGITDAVQSYLALCKGRPVAFNRVVEALKVGGVKLGDPTKPNRFSANVKTTVVNNRRRFRYNRNKNTVQLLSPSKNGVTSPA